MMMCSTVARVMETLSCMCRRFRWLDKPPACSNAGEALLAGPMIHVTVIANFGS
jgi:hypothetical protein